MAQPDPATAEWSFIKKLLFCFFFIFFLLYIFLNPNDVVPYSYYLHKLYAAPCARFITWLAEDVFHMAGRQIKFYNGTIDTVFGYVTVLFIFATALAGSFIWTATNRKRRNYYKLYQILIVILRYYLAITWIAYGSLKIVQLQFPSFSPRMLLQTYGDSSPKDLAWAFMGYSAGYNYFIGFTEYAAGLLLFFRRTSSAGNLTGLAILANVLAFNYSFDVNVKLLSTILMAMTLFLLSKDATRLLNFFVFNKPTSPDDRQLFSFNERWKTIVFQVLKFGFIFYILFFDLHGDAARAKQQDGNTANPRWYGIYNVLTFVRNGDTIKPLTTDSTRWNKIIISPGGPNATVLLMNGSLKDFMLRADTVNKKIAIYAKTGTAERYTFSYEAAKGGVLLMHGKCGTDSLTIKLVKYGADRFRLMRSNFRWIIDRNFDNKK